MRAGTTFPWRFLGSKRRTSASGDASPRVSRTGDFAVASCFEDRMFDNLTDRLGDVFDRLRRHGALTEADVGTALREIRIALLEADVALPVVRDFVAAVREKALGQEVLRSVTPAQMVVKIVHDHLVETLGGEAGGNRADGIDLNAPSPVV